VCQEIQTGLVASPFASRIPKSLPRAQNDEHSLHKRGYAGKWLAFRATFNIDPCTKVLLLTVSILVFSSIMRGY
jgi:hypothetical protein